MELEKVGVGSESQKPITAHNFEAVLHWVLRSTNGIS